MSLPDDYLEQVTLRAVQDALAAATRTYWLRRADALQAARARPGDYMGEASRESVITRNDRITLQAEQCRIHAELFDHTDVDAALLVDLLDWETAQIIAAAQDADVKAAA